MARVLRAYKDAKQIILVQDNLNTHPPSSFYERYPAEKAFKMTQGIQMVFTPKKASWLNMAEIEFSALAKQCLNRRVASFSQLQKQVNAWTIQRNRKKIQINWQFTNYKARTKFSRVYNEICSNT